MPRFGAGDADTSIPSTQPIGSDQQSRSGPVPVRPRFPAFVKFDDVRIEPGTIVDIFPGEQFVIARGNGFEAEFAGLAGTRSFEKVDSVIAQAGFR